MISNPNCYDFLYLLSNFSLPEEEKKSILKELNQQKKRGKNEGIFCPVCAIEAPPQAAISFLRVFFVVLSFF